MTYPHQLAYRCYKPVRRAYTEMAVHAAMKQPAVQASRVVDHEVDVSNAVLAEATVSPKVIPIKCKLDIWFPFM